MPKKTIFISYDYDNDKHYKNLLVAWDKNDMFDFSFYDVSVDVSVSSTDAAVIKRVISARIQNATHFLCIVGEKTYKSSWVAWEIDKAKELKRKLVAVKTAATNTSHPAIQNAGAKWALSFTFASISKAVDEA